MRKYVDEDLTFAAEELSTVETDIAMPILLYLINHENPMVREGAVYGLAGFLKNKQAIEALKTISIEDDSVGVRSAAIDALIDYREYYE